jgi:restriction endonuclease S subunit
MIIFSNYSQVENEQGYKSQIKSLKTEIHRKNEQIGTALDKIDDKSAENDEKIQTEISALKKRHAEEIKTITKKAMKLETENLVLENECKTLERQIASLRDEPKHGTSPNNKPTANKRNKNEDIGAELATHEHEEKNRKTDRKR